MKIHVKLEKIEINSTANDPKTDRKPIKCEEKKLIENKFMPQANENT